MVPIFNASGLPVCLSGLSHRLALHKEVADHERRREAMKKMRFREDLQEHDMMIRVIRHETREALEHRGESDGGDVSDDDTVTKHDFSRISLACTAKAA